MGEEGISNIYINDVMDKSIRSLRGKFSIDDIHTIKNNDFEIIQL